MKLRRRIEKLEVEHERRRLGAAALADFVADGGFDASRTGRLPALIESDPGVALPVVSRLLELADRGAALAERGAFLSEVECAEGEVLAAELTLRLQAAAAPGEVVFGVAIRFGFMPHSGPDASQALAPAVGAETVLHVPPPALLDKLRAR